MNLEGMAGAISTAANGGQTVQKDLDKPSRDNADMRPYWGKVAALVGGIDDMRAAGEKYLPKFPHEDKKDYEFRLSLAKLTNIHNEIVGSLSDKPFQEDVEFSEDDGKSVPEEFKTLAEDMTGTGDNLTVFAKSVFTNGLRYVIDWIFVDYPETEPGKIYTQAEGKALSLRPYFSRVSAENILEVKAKFINAKRVLTYLRQLIPGEKPMVRIFENDNGVVSWAEHQKNTHEEWVEIRSGVLSIDVIPFVPFITGEKEGNGWCFVPPLRDMVELQFVLYRQESGLEFTKAMAAFPMLAGNGVRPQMEADGKTVKKIAVGPHITLYAPPDGAGNSGAWTYVEPSAQSLTFLAADIKETKQDLRQLGKQPLSAQSGNVTVITATMAAGKSRSFVKACGKALSDTLENAFVIAGKFMGIKDAEYSPEVEIFEDYDDVTEGDIEALGTARANGDISRSAYLKELKRRRILSSQFDEETDAKELLDETPGEDTGEPPLPDPNKTKTPAPQPGK